MNCEPLNPRTVNLSSLSSRLRTKILGNHCLLLDEVDSTNMEAMRRADAGAEQGLVVIAIRQSHGRGRLGRSWHSFGHHSLTMSVLLRPDLTAAAISRLSLVAALGLHRALSRFATGVRIKWPNDILFDGKKLAGILTEVQTTGDRIRTVIVGIGINLSAPANGWPKEISHLATDLEHASGRNVSRLDVAAEVISSLEQAYLMYIDHGFEPIRKLWWQAHAANDKPVRVDDGAGYIEGIARGLDEHGALILETAAGMQRIFNGNLEIQQ